MHPLISLTTPLPIILNKMILVLGSRTCSVVALSALSFWFADALGPFRLTLTPSWNPEDLSVLLDLVYGSSMFAILDAYLDKRVSWSVNRLSSCAFRSVESFVAVLAVRVGFGLLMAGRTAGVESEETLPWEMALCSRKRLYCFVKSTQTQNLKYVDKMIRTFFSHLPVLVIDILFSILCDPFTLIGRPVF